jgi:pimeloyl-ACP methyl ester carboxylesterase
LTLVIDRLIDVKGVCTLYSEYGENQNKHVLFIHGLGSSSVAWRDIPYALSKYFHTITVDLVGFGGSDKPEKEDYYTIKGFSKFIVDFLEKIGIKNKKISLVGHSLGGYIATQVAIDNKEIIEKIVLIDSSGLLEGPTPLLNDYLAAATEHKLISRYEKVKRVFEDLYASPSRLAPVVVDGFDSIIEKQGAKYAFEKAFNNSTRTRLEPEELEKIKDISCLILWGEQDKLIPLKPIDYADMFQKKFKGAQCVKIPDAGHAPFVEKTALVYEILLTFLNPYRSCRENRVEDNTK